MSKASNNSTPLTHEVAHLCREALMTLVQAVDLRMNPVSKASNSPPLTREVVYLFREALITLVKATEVWLNLPEEKSALITKKQRERLEKLKKIGFFREDEREEEPEEG